MTATGTIASVVVGKKKHLNTDWPVELQLARHRKKNGFVVIEVCNGIGNGYKWFLTEKEAREYMGDFGEVTNH